MQGYFKLIIKARAAKVHAKAAAHIAVSNETFGVRCFLQYAEFLAKFIFR